LDAARFATRATINTDGSPQQTPVWYDLDRDALLMNTTIRRLTYVNLRRDPRASLCVVDASRVVTVSGRVELDEDQSYVQANITRLAIRSLGQDQGERLSHEIFSQQRRVSVLLALERIIDDDFTDMFRETERP
jgi:PPOX class probable F420-dependent enzyme